MSFRNQTYARWLLPIVILVFAGVALRSFVTKRDSPPSRSPEAGRAISQSAAQSPLRTNPSVNPVITNRTELETAEERVVALVTQGNELLEQRDYPAAAEKFQQAVSLDRNSEDLHYNLAIALAKAGKTEEAKKHYAEALQIYPEYAEAHNNLGNLLMNESKLEEAIHHFREAIRLAPDNPWFHNNLGTAFGRRGDVTDARTQFAEAVRLSATYVEARVNLGNACLAEGLVEEAVAQLNEALRLRPGFPPAVQAMQRARQKQEQSGPAK